MYTTKPNAHKHNAQLKDWTDLHASECIPQSPTYVHTHIMFNTDLHTSKCMPTPTYNKYKMSEA